jgi:hypothetical protein
MTEVEVYGKFVKPFCRDGRIFVMRVEQVSVPDVYMSKNDNVLWGELKCVNPTRGLIKPSWRPGQLAWIRRIKSYGCSNVCLILHYDGQVYFLPPRENYTREELLCQRHYYLTKLNRSWTRPC